MYSHFRMPARMDQRHRPVDFWATHVRSRPPSTVIVSCFWTAAIKHILPWAFRQAGRDERRLRQPGRRRKFRAPTVPQRWAGSREMYGEGSYWKRKARSRRASKAKTTNDPVASLRNPDLSATSQKK